MPKTLIAIPVYNAEEFIARTLRSCLNQTLKSEILVVDNCSTDTSRKIVERFQEQYNNINLVVNDRNLGRVGNWNRCLDLFDESPYEYIKFVFTGDELLPECVEKVEHVFEENHGLSVVVWPYLIRELDGSCKVSQTYDKSRRLTKENLVDLGYFPSNLTGAIICHTYAKRAIGSSRFQDIFLGAHTFSNEVVVRGDAYILNKVLSVFNLDGHKSHHKQFNYLYVLESSYTSALGLENNKNWIAEKKYRSIRQDIVLESFLRQIELSGPGLVFKLLRRLPFRLLLGTMRRFLPPSIKKIFRKSKMILYAIRVRLLEHRDIRAVLNKPRINHLVIYANAVCNAHCKMCDVGIGGGDGIAKPLEGMPRDMSLQLLEKILDDELITGKKIHVNFLMTEPLLTRKLPEMLKMCKQRHHTVKITTNGLLLAARAEEIRSHVDIVQISLDGPEEVHDSIRGKGFFLAAIEGIKTLRGMNDRVKIEINYTISNLNYFCLYDFLKLVDGLGININLMKYQCLDFVTESMRDRHNARFPDIPQTTSSISRFTDFNKIDTKVLQRQIDLIRTFKPSNIEKVSFKPPVQTVSDLEAYFHPDGHPLRGWDRCLTPWVSIAINTGGKVFWHMRCFSDYILGDINHDSLRHVFYGEKAENFRILFKESNLCFPACTRCCGVMIME